MYCPSCGNEITVELNYCNRCGASLTLPVSNFPAPIVAPVKLTAPTIVLGLTVTGGLGIIFSRAAQFVAMGLHPAAITWIVLFGTATLFGCTALLIRFWSKMPVVINMLAPWQPCGPTSMLWTKPSQSRRLWTSRRRQCWPD